MRALTGQLRAELGMTLRRGESVLLTLGIPVMLLVFFSTVHVLPTTTRHPIAFLAPGILALAVMSTSMVSLGIATGFERGYGVLKRLKTTPLGRGRLMVAKMAGVIAIEVVQVVVLVVVSLVLGWAPHAEIGALVAAIVLGTTGFAGLGLLMAGTLRAEATLALANAVYLVLLLLGGMIVPLGKLPSALAGAARVLPAAALSDALHGAFGFGGGIPAEAWIVLVAWGLAAPVAAAFLFRWE